MGCGGFGIGGSALRSGEGGAGTASGVSVSAPAGHIPDRRLGREQLRLQLVVTSLKRAGVCARAALAIPPVAVALQVAAVEDVRLVTEAAGNPLPAEVVAGGIAVKQVLQEPVGSCFPMHPAPVHQIRRHPHPCVVVEPATAHQLLAESIHTGQPRAAFTHVVGKLSAVTGGIVAGLQLLLALMDAIAEIAPHPLPEITPAQFIDQLAAVVSALAAIPQLGKDRFPDLCQGENAVSDPWG